MGGERESNERQHAAVEGHLTRSDLDFVIHLQRAIIRAGAVAIGVGYWLPWDNLDRNHINVFDHWLFRVPLVALALAIVVLAAVGNRRERVAGPAFGTIVTIGASLLVVILGLAGGGSERKSVGSVRWNRERSGGEGRR